MMTETKPKEKADELGEVARAAFEAVKLVYGEAELSQRGSRYELRLSPGGRPITVEHPKVRLSGTVYVTGLHDNFVSGDVRARIIAAIKNLGRSTIYEKPIGLLMAYAR